MASHICRGRYQCTSDSCTSSRTLESSVKASELHSDGAGNLSVEILSESHYFDQHLNAAAHVPVTWPAHLVWVEG